LKLISPTAAEKLLKDQPKRWQQLLPSITQADARPTVAPVSDEAPALEIAPVVDQFNDETRGRPGLTQGDTSMSTVKITNVRLAFPALFQPKTVNGEGEPRFSAAFPIEPGSANAKALEAAVKSVAVAEWGAKAPAILSELKGKGRIAYKESPLSKDGEVYDGFEGMHTLNASNKARPTIVDKDRTPLVEADGRPTPAASWWRSSNCGRRTTPGASASTPP
jgi:hypothetical protein